MIDVQEYPAVWLQMSGCSGCSVSVLNTVAPSIRNVLVDELVPGKHVNLRFHPTIMAGSGEPAVDVLLGGLPQKGYLLICEGAVPTKDGGAYGGVGELGGKHLSMHEKTLDLARDAMAVLAVGTCASFGGIPSGRPNPSGAKSVQAVLEEAGIDVPVVNIPGCPPHPDWFVGTVVGILLRGLPRPDDLDELGRPLVYYGKLVHENCPRRADFDAGKFAQHPGQPGCLYELGCKGPMTYADCPTRQWNDGQNWCVGAGNPCLGCVEPFFPDGFDPMYKKISEERLKRFVVSSKE